MSQIALAQTITAQQERAFSQQVYNTLMTYGTVSSLSSNSDASTFTQLFSSPSQLIYNDLVGLGGKDQLSVQDYVKNMREKVSSTRVDIKNINRGRIADKGNVYQMSVTFDKNISYINSCEIFVDAHEFYGSDYQMTATFEMDKRTGKCCISSLQGKQSGQKSTNQQYAIVQRTDERDDLVQYNGKTITFNRFDQAFIPEACDLSVLPQSLYYPDDDMNMYVVQEDENCNVVRFEYVPTRWRIKPHVAFSLGKFYKPSTELKDPFTNSSSEMEFGVDVGYTFFSKKNFKIAAFLGVGVSSNKLKYEAGKLDYAYNAGAHADMDGDTYVRHYSLSGIQQTLKATDLVIPVYADFEYRFASRFSAFVDLGVKFYSNMSNKTTSELNSYAYGVYSGYGAPLRLEDTWLNNFGQHQLSDASLGDTKLDMKFSMDALIGLGLRVKLFRLLSAEVGILYQAGLMNCWKNPNVPSNIATSSSTENDALVTYSVAEGEHVKKLVQSAESLKHSALKLNVGLILKF